MKKIFALTAILALAGSVFADKVVPTTTPTVTAKPAAKVHKAKAVRKAKKSKKALKSPFHRSNPR